MVDVARFDAPEGSRPDQSPAVQLTATMSVGEVAWAVLKRHFTAFTSHGAQARLRADVEHLHDARVAARRMRAALRLFDRVLAPAQAMRLKTELRYAAHALGEARDLDVQIAQTERWKGELRTARPEAADALLELLQGRREKARENMVLALDSRRFHDLESALQRRLRKQPPARRRSSRVVIGIAGPELICRVRRKLVRAAAAIAPSSPLPAIHRVRLRVKRLRYAVEFLEPIYGDPATGYIAALVKVQDNLGTIHDDEVAAASLRQIAGQELPARPPVALQALAEIEGLHDARAKRLRHELPHILARLRGKRWKRLKKSLHGHVTGQTQQ